ncbi:MULTISPECIES: hypothetical protein [Shewanella]|nr:MULTISPECIES: hypothetical protein [Shewanella]MDC8854892.1 hypothetical protein [Shewanella algae]
MMQFLAEPQLNAVQATDDASPRLKMPADKDNTNAANSMCEGDGL